MTPKTSFDHSLSKFQTTLHFSFISAMSFSDAAHSDPSDNENDGENNESRYVSVSKTLNLNPSCNDNHYS